MRIEEITIISDLKDQELNTLLVQRYEDRKDTLSSITKIKNIEVQGDYWPMSKSFNRFYFVDNSNEPIGYASVAYVRHSKVKNLYLVKMIYIKPEFRRQGFISSFYQFLLDNGYRIISDHEQTNGSKMVWKKLFRNYNLYLTSLGDDPIKKIKNDKDFELAYTDGSVYHKILAIK